MIKSVWTVAFHLLDLEMVGALYEQMSSLTSKGFRKL